MASALFSIISPGSLGARVVSAKVRGRDGGGDIYVSAKINAFGVACGSPPVGVEVVNRAASSTLHKSQRTRCGKVDMSAVPFASLTLLAAASICGRPLVSSIVLTSLVTVSRAPHSSTDSLAYDDPVRLLLLGITIETIAIVRFTRSM